MNVFLKYNIHNHISLAVLRKKILSLHQENHKFTWPMTQNSISRIQKQIKRHSIETSFFPNQFVSFEKAYNPHIYIYPRIEKLHHSSRQIFVIAHKFQNSLKQREKQKRGAEKENFRYLYTF